MKKTIIFCLFEFLLYLISGLILAFYLLPALTFFEGFMYREDGHKVTDFTGAFKAEQASADALFLGSSHIYTQVIPMVIWEQNGVPVYNLRSSNQPIAFSYYYLEEALKTQHPSVVFLDLLTLDMRYVEQTEGQNTNQNAVYGFPWSKTKLDFIFNALPPEQRLESFFDLYNFHNRWKDLEEQDYRYVINKIRGSFERDYMKGGLFMFAWKYEENRFLNIDKPADEIDPEIYAFNYEFIRKIAELCREKNIEFVLTMTLTSYVNDAAYRLEKVQQDLLSDGYAVDTLDLNDYRDVMKIDDTVDMWDYVHTTYEGAEKVSQFLGDHLQTEYGLIDRKPDNEWRSWDRDYLKYIDYRDRRLEQFR